MTDMSNDLGPIERDIVQARLQLEKLCASGTKQSRSHKMENHVLREKMVSIKRSMQSRVRKSMETNGTPATIYVDAVKSARASGKEGEADISQYVVSLEAQLCRSVHHMTMLEVLLRLNESQNNYLCETIKASLADEETGIQNLQVKREYSALVAKTKKMEKDYTKVLEEQRQAIAKFDREQSDGLDIVAICRHKEHSPLFFYETHRQISMHKTGGRFPLVIRQLFRSSDKTLPMAY